VLSDLLPVLTNLLSHYTGIIAFILSAGQIEEQEGIQYNVSQEDSGYSLEAANVMTISSAHQAANQKTGAVLVVGGGIGGIQAALDLAESGYYVYLVEQSPAIGGVMAQLDKTFPTNDCSICILSPKLVECGRNLNVEIITYADILDVNGKPGNFKVRVNKRAKYVNESLCTGCGICQTKCPWETDSEFDQGLGKRKAIYIPYAQAIPNVPVIDKELCAYFQKGKCRACEKFCSVKAVDFTQTDQIIELQVGSIILCPGFNKFEASLVPQYGYGKYPNVITSIEFERILSASGPYQGELLRPSDRQRTQKIAWIQCVGSRGESPQNSYCSSVCCTYAIKEAIVAKEHSPIPLDTAIFFMDMRTFGKGFEAYYERAKNEHGVRFIRCRPSVIEEVPETKNLRIKYETEDGKLIKEEFDLVVLSIGLEPSKDVQSLAAKLGIELNSCGFCQTDVFSPVAASAPGKFACGAFSGPKDIPETISQASAAAASASAFLSSARNSLVKRKIYPRERDVGGEPPRIGVFVCHCGVNIGGVVNVPEVRDYAATLPNVVYAEDNLYTCSQDAQEMIKEKIKEHNLNRVVVASCSPHTHEPLFQETIRQAGLNKYLFEMANIRDQCSWVHKEYPEEATEKAKGLVRMAVAKARLFQPLKELSIGVVDKALVIGGGVAGMTAALELADQGFRTFLVERSDKLGGNLRDIYWTLDGKDVQQFLKETIDRVHRHKLIDVYLNAEIKDITGYIGNFRTTAASQEGEKTLEHGVIIVATGGQEYKPKEYLYGEHPKVITQRELEQKLATHALGDKELNNVVMIQCVGSRNEERPYCSRVCCSQAIKNALKIKGVNPSSNIYVLYRDVRTYGFKEEFFTQARSQGIIFIQFDDNNKPEVTSKNGKLSVAVLEPILREKVVIDCDLVALSAGIVPNKNDELSKLLKTPVNEDGFFMEAHVKLRPVDSSNQGIFLCGVAHSPQMIDESISQAMAAAGRASIPLSKVYVTAEGIVSSVDAEKCIGCGLCESICAFKAIVLKQVDGVNKAETIPALCTGCGVCAASCPQQARTMGHFTDDELIAQINALAVT